MPAVKQKQKDFQKKKLKVGKKKPLATSHTDTSFKSKSILIPLQSIVEEASKASLSEPVTSRNQTLKDLLSLLNHTNAGTRKDGLAGIKELFSAHSRILQLRLSLLTSALLKMILDQDDSVRKILLSVIQVVYGEIPKDVIQPFFPTIMVYTGSSLSHIRDDIRLDALKFFQFWLQRFPTLVVESELNMGKIFPNLLAMMTTIDSQKRSLVNNPDSRLGLSPSRLLILDTLDMLITAMRQSKDAPPIDQVGIVCRWDQVTKYPPVSASPCSSAMSFSLLNTTDAGIITMTEFDLKTVSQNVAFISKLQPVLIDLWMEMSSAFNSASHLTVNIGMQSSRTILSILTNCWKNLGELVSKEVIITQETIASLKTCVPLVEKHIFARFPFESSSMAASFDPQAMLILRECSLMVSELYSIFFNLQLFDISTVSIWTKNVLEYVGTTLKNLAASSESQLKSEQLESILNLVSSFFKCLPLDRSAMLFDLVIALHLALHPQSIHRRTTYDFIHAYLVQHCIEKAPSPLFTQYPDVSASVQRFLLSLPRFLWELKDRHQSTTQQIFKLLIRVFMRNSHSGVHLLDEATIQRIKASLVPYFGCEVMKQGKKVQVESVYDKLDTATQNFAGNLLVVMNRSELIGR